MKETVTINNEVMMDEIRNLISEGKTVQISVKGNSMNPFMVHLRDQVILGPWSDTQIRKGAVVLVRDDRGIWLIHRIISIKDNIMTLQGDGNVGTREKALTGDVIGLMHGTVRNGKHIPSQSFLWKTYSSLWMLLKPFRGILLAFYRKYICRGPLL